MKALIDPRFNRVCELHPGEGFLVAPPLFWVDCPEDTVPDSHEWDGEKIVPPRDNK
jgi:hypothetical protein